MKTKVATFVAPLALGFALCGPALAGGFKVDVTCPESVAPNTALRVDVKLTADKTDTVDALGVSMVGNRNSTLASLALFGPKKRRVEQEVEPGTPLVLTGVKVKRLPSSISGSLATVVVTPLNESGEILGYDVCEVLVE